MKLVTVRNLTCSCLFKLFQDFVRLPWQNQSSQSSHSIPAGAGVQSGSAALAGTYGPGSGQINPGYSIGPGTAGYEAVSQISDDVAESNLAPQFRFIFVQFVDFFDCHFKLLFV